MSERSGSEGWFGRPPEGVVVPAPAGPADPGPPLGLTTQQLADLVGRVVAEARTSGVDLVVHTGVCPWDREQPQITVVVGGASPEAPRWVGYDHGLHQAVVVPHAVGCAGPPGNQEAEVWAATVGHAADAIRDLVVVELTRRGQDHRWPPCPDHPGAHALSLEHRWEPALDRNGWWWRCPGSDERFPETHQATGRWVTGVAELGA